MLGFVLLAVISLVLGILFCIFGYKCDNEFWSVHPSVINFIIAGFFFTFAICAFLTPFKYKSDYVDFKEEFEINKTYVATLENKEYARDIAEKYNQQLNQYQTEFKQYSFVKDLITDEVMYMEPITIKEP